MTFKDFRNIMRSPNRDLRRGTLMGAVLRYRLMADPVAEAEYYKVPFTPIWWWWNAEADEYILTMWDTNAGKEPPMYSFGSTDPRVAFGTPTKLVVSPSIVNSVRKITRK